MNTTQRRRLERAGFAYVQSGLKAGWVPAKYAAQVAVQIDAWQAEVAALADVPATRGRPKKTG